MTGKQLEENGGRRRGLLGFGRVSRLVAAAAIVTFGAGALNVSSSSAAGSAPLVSSTAHLTPAQQSVQNEQNAVNNMLTPAPAGYKNQLVTQFNSLASTVAKYPADFNTQTNMVTALQQASRDVSVLDDTQLANVYRVFSKVPGWNSLSSQINHIERSKAHMIKAMVAMDRWSAHLKMHPNDFNPTPPNDCSTPAFEASIYGLIATHIIAEGVATGLEKFAEGTPDSFVIGLIVLGEGTVLTLPISPEREPEEIAQAVLELVAQAAEGAEQLMEHCNQANFQEEVAAFKEYTHAYVPVKKLDLKVVPASGGTQFLLTGTEDGLAVKTEIDYVHAIQIVNGAAHVVDITGSVTSDDVDTGVLLLTMPSIPSAAAFEIQAHSEDQTDPTAGGEEGQSHTGVITFTKTG